MGEYWPSGLNAVSLECLHVPMESLHQLCDTYDLEKKGEIAEVQLRLQNFLFSLGIVDEAKVKSFFGALQAADKPVVCEKLGWKEEDTPELANAVFEAGCRGVALAFDAFPEGGLASLFQQAPMNRQKFDLVFDLVHAHLVEAVEEDQPVETGKLEEDETTRALKRNREEASEKLPSGFETVQGFQPSESHDVPNVATDQAPPSGSHPSLYTGWVLSRTAAGSLHNVPVLCTPNSQGGWTILRSLDPAFSFDPPPQQQHSNPSYNPTTSFSQPLTQSQQSQFMPSQNQNFGQHTDFNSSIQMNTEEMNTTAIEASSPNEVITPQ